jgi:hypothetical protein
MNTETEQKVQKVDKLLTDILVYFPYPRGGETDLWPSMKELSRLDVAVLNLAMTQRKKPLLPPWKAFELVNRRWPKLKLVKRVKELVEHARDRLKEASKSELEPIRREAFEGAANARRLIEHLGAIQVDANKAAAIDWQDYKELLFRPGNYRLACDAPTPQLRRSGFSYSNALISEPSRERCYARALEILTDDLRYEPLRDKAGPLLCWMVTSRNPDYYGVLKSHHMEWLVRLDKEIAADTEEKFKKQEQREQNLSRQRIHRLRKIFTRHERAMLARVMYRKALSEFRAEVSEADFVRKFSR